MRLSDLQNKDVVNVIDGKKIGIIIDVSIDLNGKMNSFVIERNKSFSSMFSKSEEIEISWDQIEKIGTDVILVRVSF